jgi:hypothetical protein
MCQCSLLITTYDAHRATVPIFQKMRLQITRHVKNVDGFIVQTDANDIESIFVVAVVHFAVESNLLPKSEAQRRRDSDPLSQQQITMSFMENSAVGRYMRMLHLKLCLTVFGGG